MINPLIDFGISSYTHELAEGLVSNGVQVDVYMSEHSRLPEFTRHYRRFPVLGSTLFRQTVEGDRAPSKVPLNPTEAPNRNAPSRAPSRHNRVRTTIRQAVLAAEFAIHLKRERYDLVWTQWPDFYGPLFWRMCRILNMTVAHTVHNVQPHEETTAARKLYRQVYRFSDRLFVHSSFTREELLRFFPKAAGKVAIMRHGTYTIYKRRPELRSSTRRKLEIADDQIAVLFCGGIRPYKNLDGLLRALGEHRDRRFVLVVSGQESGYEDSDPNDPLGRTRRMVEELGLTATTRLLPGFLDFQELGDLCEACDIISLAYEKHYGSGLLLQAMTFGMHVLATKTGGTEEYLESYPWHTLVASANPSDLGVGLAQAAENINLSGAKEFSSPELAWNVIAGRALSAVAELPKNHSRFTFSR